MVIRVRMTGPVFPFKLSHRPASREKRFVAQGWPVQAQTGNSPIELNAVAGAHWVDRRTALDIHDVLRKE